jgi:hypothetical protein
LVIEKIALKNAGVSQEKRPNAPFGFQGESRKQPTEKSAAFVTGISKLRTRGKNIALPIVVKTFTGIKNHPAMNWLEIGYRR